MGLVLGIGFAAALTAAAGARRTESAFPDMLRTTDAPEILVSSDNEDHEARLAFYNGLADLDDVERVGLIVGVLLVPSSVAKGEGTVLQACSVLSMDGRAGYTVGRPNLLEGRLPRPGRSDEVLLTQGYAEAFGGRVGDELDLVVPRQSNPPAGEATAADGPVVHATIVGIGVPATQVVPLSDLDAAPTLVAGPALVARYAPDPESSCYDGAMLDLAGDAYIDGVVAEIDRISGPSGGALVQNLADNYADVRRAIQPQVTALWLFAAVAGIATLLVVAQLLGRQFREAAGAVPVWRAMGVTRTQARALLTAPSVVTGIVGSGIAVVTAVVLSGRFPIGPARLAESARGTELHALLHLGGGLGVALAAVVIGSAAASVSLHRRTGPARVGSLTRISGISSKPAVVVGINLAANSGGRNAPVPVRSAVAGTALAIGAVVATVTFAGGLNDLVSEPSRYGRDWDVVVDGEFALAPVARILDELGEDRAVAAIAGGRYGEVTIDGTRVPTVGLSDLVGATFPALIEGRSPTRADEIVVGRRSLDDLQRSVGDTVMVDTGTGPQEMTVVGTAAFPRINHGSFSTLGLGIGAIARAEAFPPRRIEEEGEAPPEIDLADFVGPEGTGFEFVTIRLRETASSADLRRVVATASRIGRTSQQQIRTEQRPIAIDNYAAVRSTPAVLAGLLGLMAAATLAHLVVSVVRQRRRDLALCVALGMGRAQVTGAVMLQAVLMASVSMLVGLPLGLAAGRLSWASFASDLGVADSLRLPIATVGLVVPCVLVVATAVALVPAILAARTPSALVLRSE